MSKELILNITIKFWEDRMVGDEPPNPLGEIILETIHQLKRLGKILAEKDNDS